ncbi:MAG TPA: prephenate dehydrogenase, partial [Sumerlaeia bacterium]|nr:prephenate dehydrogenase [Sumerlaeia bacterium]
MSGKLRIFKKARGARKARAEGLRAGARKAPEGEAATRAQPLFQRAAICGVGLLGGSLGMALRRRGLAKSVVGVGRDAERLALAVEKGAIDSYTLDLEQGCADADAIVLCGPVSVILDQIPAAMAVAPSGALVTDVGSTKRSIVQRASQQPRDDVFFVGSHPIAGSEKSGAAHARADLFDGATVVLTPALSTSDEALERTRRLWESVGMRVVEVLPSRHDEILAMVSHLPHLVACALMAQASQGLQNHNAEA